MKYLILFLAIMSLSLTAQDKKNNDKTAVNNQAKEWMNKISSNFEMREEMMAMLLDKTKGNKEEMMKLGRKIMDYPEMNSIISGMMKEKKNTDNMNIEPRGMMSDSTKKMKMSGYKVIPQK
jgi:hypothetical protein